MGLDYQRFQGPAPLDGAGAIGVATGSGLAVTARVGLEALRTSDVRLLCFLDLELPTFVSHDPDHGVIDQWVPAASLGCGRAVLVRSDLDSTNWRLLSTEIAVSGVTGMRESNRGPPKEKA